MTSSLFCKTVPNLCHPNRFRLKMSKSLVRGLFALNIFSKNDVIELCEDDAIGQEVVEILTSTDTDETNPTPEEATLVKEISHQPTAPEPIAANAKPVTTPAKPETSKEKTRITRCSKAKSRLISVSPKTCPAPVTAYS